MTRRTLLPALYCATVVGCSPGHDEPATTSQCGDATCSGDESAVSCPDDCYRAGILRLDLDRCRAGLSDRALADAIDLGLTFVERLDVLRTVEDLGTRLANDAAGAPIQLAYHPQEDVISVPFSFDPNTGTYARELPVQGKAALEVVFLFGDAYQAGAKGTPIRDYLFKTDSYVVGAAVDLGSFEATVSFTTPGPLVELLGMGPSPPNPFTMSLFEADDEMDRQHQKWVFDVDEQLPGRVRVLLTGEIKLEHLAIADEQIPITLKHASARRGDGEKLDVTEWRLHFDRWETYFKGEDERLFGSVSFSVRGGALDYRGKWIARQSSHPELVLSCP